MNKDVIQGKWNEIKGDLRRAWGDVSDDEWEKTKGDTTAIAGVLQQRYGFAREEASTKVASFFEKYTSKAREALQRDDADMNKDNKLN